MTRLYRRLLHLYPASFRVEYGEDMCAIFAQQLTAANGLSRLGLMLKAAMDVITSAIAAHGDLLRQDLRYTARSLRHSRGFAAAAVAVIAIGVGANTAAFSVTDFVLLRPLPYPEQNTLVRLCWGPKSGPGWGCMNQLSPANYRDYKNLTPSFQALGAFYGSAVNLVGAGDPQRLATAQVTTEVLPLLGVPPVIGRLFDSDQADPDGRTLVLSYGLWQTQYGGDPGVLGRSVTLDGAPYTVVGVMPRGFHFPTGDVQAWTHLVLQETAYDNRDDNYLEAVGRLKPGVTMDQARADLQVVAERLARDYPEVNGDAGFSFFSMRDNVLPRYRVMLLGLCGASLCILLLTCANLANLLLARAGARERELAVRAALGAGRERLVRQMVTESMTLALAGGVAGLLLAAVALPLLSLLVPNTLPSADHPTLNPRVLAAAAGFAALTGLGFGLIPALRVGGRTGLDGLRQGSRSGGRKQRLRQVLVGVEVTVSVVLLIVAGLLIRSVWRVQSINPGFAPERLITVNTTLPRPKYDITQRRLQFYHKVLSEIRGLPGVRNAAYITGLPMVMTGRITGVTIPGREVSPTFRTDIASIRFVTPGFFQTMEIPLLRGRDIEDGDIQGRPAVAVVSESFAQTYWPNEDPIGRTFVNRVDTATVVGVVGDIKVRGLERTSEPQMYLSAGQVPDTGFINDDPKVLVIRYTGSSDALVPAVGQIIRTADPEQPIANVRHMEEIVAGETAPRRAQLNVLGALGAIALLLSGVGIYGLLAYTVTQRSREIGVRLALGANPAGVARMVVSQGMKLALLGMVPGIVAGFLAARGMRALLFGVAPTDPLTMTVAAALVLVTTLAGSLIPALRAVRVSPMVALRME